MSVCKDSRAAEESVCQCVRAAKDTALVLTPFVQSFVMTDPNLIGKLFKVSAARHQYHCYHGAEENHEDQDGG